MRQLLLIFSLSFLGQHALSQIVNIENKRIFDDTSGWYGAIDGTFSMIQNKEVLYQTNLRGKVQFKTRKHYSLFLLDQSFSGSSAKIYANSGMAHYRYAYRLWNSAWKWENYAQVQYNQLLQQRLRALLGSGIRVKFADNKLIKAYAGTSTFYEYEELSNPSIYQADFRWSSYASWFLKGKNVSFTGVTYYQPLWRDFNDFRVAGQYTLSIQLNKTFRFKSEYNLFYDSQPPLGVRKSVSSLLLGMSCEFGK